MDDQFSPYNATDVGDLGNVPSALDVTYAPPIIQQEGARNLFQLGMTFMF